MSRYQAFKWWRVGRWGDAINSWAIERGLGSNSVSFGYGYHQGWYVTDDGVACITRAPIFFDTTTLTGDIETALLKVYGRGIVYGDEPFSPDSICVVSAPDVHSPPVEADYGYLGTRVVGLAPALYVPDTTYRWHYFIFNTEGIAAINKGGITKLACRHLTDLSNSDPGVNKAHSFYVPYYYPGEGSPLGLQIWLVINELPSGYIWVEGIYLAYIDSSFVKRLKEGTTTGNNGTAGHIWVEGDYFHYIDANGDERRILGTVGDATGKASGHIWMEETGVHYIDSSGQERYFEGT
jgi:hypothetical protein